jgi:protein-disulfide isomerase
MTDTEKTIRLPVFILSLIGVFLLSGAAVYFWQNSNSNTALQGAASPSDAEAVIKSSGLSDADRKTTEAVVRAYILQNPEIITEAVALLQTRDMAGRVEKVGAAIHQPFAGNYGGNPKGDITLVEFTDYNCGYCRSTVADVDKLLAADKNIRVVYRETPVLSPTSRDAALMALAAAKQGKHHEFHRAMFDAGRPSADTIRKAAQNVGLDITVAQAFIASEEAGNELKANQEMMQKIGFNGTPTFIVGGNILEGAQGYDSLKKLVDNARSANK